MNEIARRLGHIASLVLICGTVSCAKGYPSAPPADVDIPAQPVMVNLCGNGKIDPGEMCDCPTQLVSPTGTCPVDSPTCDQLQNGYIGKLQCNAKTCMYDTSICRPVGGVAGAGGTGAGAGSAGTGR